MARIKFNLNGKKLQRGQSLVEMSIGMVLIVTILSGLLDLGRIYYIYTALEDSAGEAALFLSINPNCPRNNGLAACSGNNNAEIRARNSGGNFVNWNDPNSFKIEVEMPADGAYGVGDPVTVRVKYSFQLLTPIIPRIAGVNPLTLEATATQIIIGE